MSKSVAFAALPLLAACYGAAPPKPARIPLPPIVDGAELAVYTEERTRIESVQRESQTCPQGHANGSPACVVTRYTVKEPVTRTYSTATYADQPISYAQFRVLTDSQYDHKLSRLEDLSRTCQRANVPRYAGIALFLGGLIGGPIIGKATDNTTAHQLVFWGGMAGGASSYALGYFAFGGRDCNEARGIYHDVNVAGDANTNTVIGGSAAVEMQELAARFNANQSRQSAMKMR